MKQTRKPRTKRRPPADDLRAHYDFDRSQAKPNRFAGRFGAKNVVVLLDPDVSAVFKDAESVNTVLRSLITTMPPVRKAGKR